MKLVLAKVQDEDSEDLIEELNDAGYRVTKLATTGGFLKSGNTTLMIGVDEDKVKSVVAVIEDVCKRRKQVISTQSGIGSETGIYMSYPMEVEVGGATVFVIDVDQFIKI